MYTILLSGKQGSGKSTLAKLMESRFRAAGFGLVRDRFAAPVYAAHDAVLSVLRPLGLCRGVEKDGKLLQVIGTEWGRSIDPDIWIKATKAKIAQLEQNFASTPSVRLVVLIEDCRFKNEFDAFPDAFSIRLECPENIRKPRTHSWRENTSHESETGLDDYSAQGKFDYLVRTDTVRPEDIAVDVLKMFRQKFSLEAGK